VTLTREDNGSPAAIGGKSSANVVQMWCTAPLAAPRGADFSPSHGRDLDFLWSGRRDSNPRPSPWQGVGIRASSVAPSAYVGSVRLFVREVLPNPSRSNTRYYGKIGSGPSRRRVATIRFSEHLARDQRRPASADVGMHASTPCG